MLAGGAATTLVVAQRSGKVAGTEHVQRERATGTEAGGKALIGKPIRAGTKLPTNVAISTVQVRLNAGEPRKIQRLVRVSCPRRDASARASRSRAPRTARTRTRQLRTYQYSLSRHGPARARTRAAAR